MRQNLLNMYVTRWQATKSIPALDVWVDTLNGCACFSLISKNNCSH